MLLVQEYLRTKTFGDLEREHGVNASLAKNGYLISLNYDQLAAVESDKLSQQCRGLVLAIPGGRSLLDQAVVSKGKPDISHICPGETEIAAYPMTRFFNYGQGSAANISLSEPTLKSVEKLDGTLCIVYKNKYANQWEVATRSVAQADIPLDGGEMTFRKLFEMVCQQSTGMTYNDLTALCNPDYTYCFELCSRFNRIVVDYPTPKIVLLAVRNNLTGLELDPETTNLVTQYKIQTPKVYNLGASMNEMFDWVNAQNPFDMEGVVLRDVNFNRIKVKSAAYVAYNRVHDLRLGTSNRNCLEILLLEKEDDILPMLPEEIANKLLAFKTKLTSLIHDTDNAYSQYANEASGIEDLKERAKQFALKVNANKNLWAPAIFTMYRGKATSTSNFIKSNQDKGSWTNSFLDGILNQLGYKVTDL